MNKAGHGMKCLFVCYGGGHVAMLIPVIRALRRQVPDADITVLGLTTAADVLHRAGIPALGFRDLLRPQDEQARVYGERLAAGQPPHTLVSREETVAYLGLSYRDLVYSTSEADAEKLYAEKQRAAFKPLPTLLRFMSELQPDVVVATNSPRAEQAAIDAAGILGIPSVCVVDLFVSYDIAWLGRAGYASRVCMLAEPARERLLQAGRHPDEIVVTGNPAFDVLGSQPSEADRALFRERHGLKPGLKVIFWASQDEPEIYTFTGERGDPDLPREVDRQLMALMALHPDWQLVIRPHPSEVVNYPDPLPPRVSISRLPGELPLVLDAADVVITFSSTVGLEGALLGKPLISLQQSVHAKYAPFLGLGIARLVHEWAELEPAIEESLASGAALLSGLPAPGESADRIAGIMVDLVRRNGEAG